MGDFLEKGQQSKENDWQRTRTFEVGYFGMVVDSLGLVVDGQVLLVDEKSMDSIDDQYWEFSPARFESKHDLRNEFFVVLDSIWHGFVC